MFHQSLGSVEISTVYAIPHAKNNLIADFSHIISSNHDVKMTPDHLLFAGQCNTPLVLMKAVDVETGACIRTISGEEKVLSNDIVKASGIYTIITDKEFLVVNGIVASPFSRSHMMGNYFYFFYRAFYAIFPNFVTDDWFIRTYAAFSNLVLILSA